MKRRDFIRVLGAGTTAVLAAPSLMSLANTAHAEEFWYQPPAKDDDIRLSLLAYAILAPSAHNTQPWLVKLEGQDALKLYVDKKRLLPETDPPARQIHISQGTFIENLVIIAKQYGYRLELQYFPEGLYANDTIEDKPVAAVRLNHNPDIKPDPLLPSLLTRHSNKRVYDDRAVSNGTLASLRRIPLPHGMELHLSNDAEHLQQLPPMLTRAMEIEVSNHQRDLETIHMFRFNDEEIAKHRDGLSVAQTGKTGFSKWLVESFFISRAKATAPDSSFAQQSIDLTRNQAHSSQAFGWLTTRSNSRLDQVIAGQVYERLNLASDALGLAQHPMSQILEEYEDMTELKRSFYDLLQVSQGHTVQMFFRLGYAKAIPHTPRRPVRDLFG